MGTHWHGSMHLAAGAPEINDRRRPPLRFRRLPAHPADRAASATMRRTAVLSTRRAGLGQRCGSLAFGTVAGPHARALYPPLTPKAPATRPPPPPHPAPHLAT